MASQFNFTPLRNTAISLVKYFGRKVQLKLLRSVDGTAPDTSLPWRVSAGSILEFPFTGTLSTLGFPKRSDPIMDGDVDVIAPGDLLDTPATGSPGVLCGMPTVADRIIDPASGIQYAILGVQDVSADQTFIVKLRCKAWPNLIKQPSTGY